MCKVNRREFLAASTAFLSVVAEAEPLEGETSVQSARDSDVDRIAPDVYFHQGDVTAESAPAVCNNGWIIFEDCVLVIDANFPAGAQLNDQQNSRDCQ